MESCPGPAPLPYIGPLITLGPCMYLFLQVQSGCDMWHCVCRELGPDHSCLSIQRLHCVEFSFGHVTTFDISDAVIYAGKGLWPYQTDFLQQESECLFNHITTFIIRILTRYSDRWRPRHIQQQCRIPRPNQLWLTELRRWSSGSRLGLQLIRLLKPATEQRNKPKVCISTVAGTVLPIPYHWTSSTSNCKFRSNAMMNTPIWYFCKVLFWYLSCS